MNFCFKLFYFIFQKSIYSIFKVELFMLGFYIHIAFLDIQLKSIFNEKNLKFVTLVFICIVQCQGNYKMNFSGWFTLPLCGPLNMHLAPKAKKKNTKIGFSHFYFLQYLFTNLCNVRYILFQFVLHVIFIYVFLMIMKRVISQLLNKANYPNNSND